MSHFSAGLRVTAVSALIGSLACLGTATATADPNSGNPADLNALGTSLSKGYTVSNCTAQTISGGELAALTCGQNPDAAGPVQGKYILFGSADALAASFKTSIKDDALTTCGDAGQSPTPWHTGNSTTNSGQVACGTYQNGAEIIWTTDAKNVLSYIRGSNTDVPALYQWWKTNG
jgi:hypothetical protein